MAWGSSGSFPRAILHIDGDSFFAACEVAKNPSLRGKPVITGKERGIVSAATYEAKARGVKRGVPLHEALKACPDAIILPSDYETYSLFSNRMYEIVRRYTPAVEEYSIDECFADLTGLRRTLRMPYPKIALKLQEELESELGLSFSIGVAPTKVLAKVGSKWKKPHGLTMIPLYDVHTFLAKTPTIGVWGIGPNTAAYLQKFGIRTALDFVNRDEAEVRDMVTKPIYEIWRELKGEVVYELDTEGRGSYQSISKTKTFTPPSSDPRFVAAQLSKNVENACIKARRWGLATPEIFFFLKTQEFKYHGCEIKLSHPTCIPNDILSAVRTQFLRVFKRGTQYRATGIVLMKLQDANKTQLDLFGSVLKTEAAKSVYESLDEIAAKYGKHAIFLGSSFHAMKPQMSKVANHSPIAREEKPARHRELFKGETARRRLGVASLGEVN
jgi:DNA polymerase-4/DNA polymerase V